MSVDALLNILHSIPIMGEAINDLQAAKQFVSDYLYNQDVVTADIITNSEILDRYAMAHPPCERHLKEGRLTPVEEGHYILPISQGGAHRESTLMLLCQSCYIKVRLDMGDR